MPENKKKPRKSNFRIIAIQPNEGCNDKLVKVLQTGKIYYFYNEYHIQNDRLAYQKKYSKNLYNSEQQNINISAIVGQNGSGKSTIVELLFAAINNIAYYFKIKDDLKLVERLKVSIYYQYGGLYKLVLNEEEISVYKYSNNGVLNKEKEDFTKKDLFYTICINYSHYAYNIAEYSDENQKDWLSALFHKNDAYQTPLVINPWRDKGDIKIDRENELVRSRLLANLLRSESKSTVDFKKITKNLVATRLVLTPNRDKIYNGEIYSKNIKKDNGENASEVKMSYNDLKINVDKVLRKINRVYDFNYKKYSESADEYESLAMAYLVRKLISISIKYDEYEQYYKAEEDNFDWLILDEYIRLVVGDRSHIGFKFKQTLNYLKYKHIQLDTDSLYLKKMSNSIYTQINKKKTHKSKVIELIPPPIFTIDIVLETVKGDSKEVLFKTLSSGEKQMVYSISSILYHLFNINSVSRTTKNKTKYRQVNVILEEIELYFHPELQRNYIKLLRESIINLGLDSINTISICFVTHSPFILSDIPDSNIMFLEVQDGKAIQVQRNEKTFGANIHNLLADSFFMQDGVCGAFAVEKINEAIIFLNTTNRIKRLQKKLQDEIHNNKKECQKRINELAATIAHMDKTDCWDIIESVGEPVMAIKLKDMFYEAFPYDKDVLIQNEILRLEKLLKK